MGRGLSRKKSRHHKPFASFYLVVPSSHTSSTPPIPPISPTLAAAAWIEPPSTSCFLDHDDQVPHRPAGTQPPSTSCSLPLSTYIWSHQTATAGGTTAGDELCHRRLLPSPHPPSISSSSIFLSPQAHICPHPHFNRHYLTLTIAGFGPSPSTYHWICNVDNKGSRHQICFPFDDLDGGNKGATH